MTNRKSLIWFLIITFSLAWVLFILPVFFGPAGSPVRQQVTIVAWAAAMWAPGLAAILVTRLVDRQPLRVLNLRHLGEKRAYLWAWLTPLALSILTGLLTWAFGFGQLDTQFSFLRQAISATPGTETIPVWVIVAGQIILALTLAPLINTLFALGEELGWRGFLMPGLLHLGQWRAILISGVIWGVWHAPAILQGHNYPQHPALGVFLMIVWTVLCGTFLSWVYLRTRSPWAPALGHGAINAISGLPLLFLANVDTALGGTLGSLAGWIPQALFIAWLAWTKRLPVKVEEGGSEVHEAPIVQSATL